MITRAITTNKVSSPESVELRESLLSEVQAWGQGAQDERYQRLLNLILDGQEPTVQLFGGATLTDIGSDL